MVDEKLHNEIPHYMNCSFHNKGRQKREYFSIFGSIEFYRNKYYIPENQKVIYPLDLELGIENQKYSFVLQNWIGFNSSDTDYRSSVELINRIMGYDFHAMQSHRITNSLSEFVEDYYQDSTLQTQSREEGGYFAVGFDDKGVPIKASEQGKEVQSNAVRLGKGQKRDVKKHCTVSVSYSFDERVRSAEDVIKSFFKEVPKEKDKKPEADETSKMAKNKHIRGFMTDKTKAIEYGFEQVGQRNKEHKKIVVLIDGDRGLSKAVKNVIEKKNISSQILAMILDFIHVTEYLWDVANAHFGEKSPLRLDWVKTQCLLVLKSEMSTVLVNLDNLLELNKGKLPKEEKIQKTIKYFINHKEMMDYKTYLENGYPISTGAIESACGHFVQKRMEQNGMHWSMSGAQKMLNIRAINKNKDWDSYMEYYIKKKTKIIDFQEYKLIA
jgi:hypothetical protein